MTKAILCAWLVGLGLMAAPTYANTNAEKASVYYEDALARFGRDDFAGSIVQIKNALQQDNKMLAAHVLLARNLVKMGELATAEVAINTALNLGVARSEVAPLLGAALYGQGKYLALIEKVSAHDLPTSAQIDVLILRGSAHSELGDYKAAAKEFERARGLNPDSIPTLLADSALQIKLNRPDEALRLVDRALSLAPNDPEALTVKANLLVAVRKFPEAMAAYDKALAAKPDYVEARVGRATLTLDLGLADKAQPDVDMLTRSAPNDPRVALLRATLASRRGDNKAVQKALGEAVAVIDPLPAEVRARRPQLLMIGGAAHYGLGNMQKTREYLEVLVRLQPRNLGAVKLLASSFLATGDAARAVALLEPMRALAPTDAGLLTLLGNAQLVQKKYEKAAALYQEAAKHGAADSPDLLANLGLSLAGLGQNAQALKPMQAAFAARPGDLRTGMSLASLMLKQQDSKGAVAVMRQVVAANPNNPLAHNMLGVALGGQGDLAAARQSYEKAVSLDRKFNAAVLNLARLDVAVGKLSEGRARLDVLLRSEPNNSDVMYELALLELAAKQPQDAIRWLEKARLADTRNVRAMLLLSDVYLSQGQAAKAQDAAKGAQLQQPENMKALATLANAQIAAGDTAGARATLTAMTRLAEFDPDQQVLIARMQLRAANQSGANYSIGKALTNKPDHFAALSLQAELAMQSGDFARADSLSKNLVAKYPDRAVGYHIQGDVALSRGQSAAAISAHRTALAREPGTEAALRVFKAYLQGGEATKGVAFLQEWQRGSKNPDQRIAAAIVEGQMVAGDWKGARNSLEALIQAQGATPSASLLNNLAYVLMKLNDPAELGYAERAWKAAPNSAEIIDTYGWALARAGRHDQALKLLRDARLRAPKSAAIRYHLGWTLAAAGRKNEAREELRAAIADSPKGFDGIDDAKKLLNSLGT